MEKLNNLKLRLGIEGASKDAILSSLLNSARIYILSYTGRNAKSWLEIFDDLQLKIAIVDYNRLGIENLSSQSEGSVSNSYIEGYPKEITSILDKYRVCKVL